MSAVAAFDALLVERDLTMRVGRREVAPPAADEALIAVEWAGVCGSDLHVLRSGAWVVDWPATLGHEIYGRILSAPEASGLAPGTPVVSDSRLACGRCAACAGGDPDRCAAIQFVGELRPGGFATHCVLPASMLHAIDAAVPGSTAVLAEPLAVAIHALSHLHHEPKRMAILGHGPIGALVHIEARRRWPGCRIDVAEPAPLRGALARALGADAAASACELQAASFDVVVDAAGYASSLTDAITLAADGSHILLVGLGHAEIGLVPGVLVEHRLQLSGCHAFIDELPQAIALLSAEGWRYEPVVTDVVALSELPAALAGLLDHGDAVKLLVAL